MRRTLSGQLAVDSRLTSLLRPQIAEMSIETPCAHKPAEPKKTYSTQNSPSTHLDYTLDGFNRCEWTLFGLKSDICAGLTSKPCTDPVEKEDRCATDVPFDNVPGLGYAEARKLAGQRERNDRSGRVEPPLRGCGWSYILKAPF